LPGRGGPQSDGCGWGLSEGRLNRITVGRSPLGKTKSLTARIAWALAGLVSLWAVENIWIDRWVQERSHRRVPSLLPETLGGMWSLVMLAFALGLFLAVVCVVLLIKDRGVAGWKKALTGGAVLVAAILAGEWFAVTGGTALLEQICPHTHKKEHSVELQWYAGKSTNVRYNIYRGPDPGVHPTRLNEMPVDGLTFKDTTVEGGKRYYYVARAVDPAGQESTDSNEAFADVPGE
jgi:hypothetical protein